MDVGQVAMSQHDFRHPPVPAVILADKHFVQVMFAAGRGMDGGQHRIQIVEITDGFLIVDHGVGSDDDVDKLLSLLVA